MEFIGEYLKSVRLKKNIKLSSISKELKISIDLLHDIEKDNFPEYLDKVFLIGHIRSFAKYLEIDQNEVIQNFKIQTRYYDTGLNNEIARPIENKNLFSFPKAISYFSVVVFASAFYLLFVKTNNFQNDYAMTPDIPENLIYKLEESEMEIALSQKENNLYKNINSNSEKYNFDNIKINSSSAIASLPIEKETYQKNKDINLKFLNNTWIQIRNQKDEIVFSRLMNKDEEYSYNVFNNYTLTAGNAGNIIISIDNIVLGKVGKAGEVVDSLIIDKSFNQ